MILLIINFNIFSYYSFLLMSKYTNRNNLLRFKPVTPSLRHTCLINKSNIWSGKSFKHLTLELGKSNTGRNRAGRIILFTKSNRKHNLLYRIIDYKYSNFGVPCIVHRIEYDPNRTSFICLNIYINGVISYSIQTQNVKASSLINSYFQSVIAFNISSGDTFFLRYIPEGSSINNIEKHPFSGSLYSRSAGTSSTLIRKYESLNRCLVKLGSGYYKVLNMNCKATIGSVSNRWSRYINLGKAGRSRWLGVKPNVRGVAMNPIDHPHGGGEGKKSKKPSPRSAWGKMFKWIKTSNNYKIRSPNLSTFDLK